MKTKYNKSSKIITESIGNINDNTDDTDAGTLLDENNIL
jgi:hypothetical protein